MRGIPWDFYIAKFHLASLVAKPINFSSLHSKKNDQKSKMHLRLKFSSPDPKKWKNKIFRSNFVSIEKYSMKYQDAIFHTLRKITRKTWFYTLNFWQGIMNSIFFIKLNTVQLMNIEVRMKKKSDSRNKLYHSVLWTIFYNPDDLCFARVSAKSY